MGGFEHSNSEHEVVFNVQTNILFIDMCIPHLVHIAVRNNRPASSNNSSSSRKEELLFSHLNNDQLRLSAWRYAFAINQNQPRLVCTQYHCIDWNLVGRKGRNQLNKWFVEMHPIHSNIL